jgi:NADPH2:quinone reductase
VAAVYDGIGATTFRDGLRAIAPTGRMILYGAASGQPEPLELGLLASSGSLYVQRPTLQTYARTPELFARRAELLFELIASGALEVRIGGRYPLEQARQAHTDLEARLSTGKLLLYP